MTRRARHRRRAFALIEAVVAVLIVGVVLLALLQVRNQAMQQYLMMSDQRTGAWLAEMMMAELISEALPDPQDEATWSTSGSGDFSDLNNRLNDINLRGNASWTDRATFTKFEYEWTKELVFIGTDFIGSKAELDAWEAPVNDRGEPTGEKSPLDEPLARVVRVTLTLFIPAQRQRNAEGEEVDDQQHEKNRTIRLVTYVDPNTLHAAEIESVDQPAGGTGTGGTGTGGTGTGR
ncbi:MAG: prepilin-type N-terminal cleavage/methylation domain-containing protein [Planctomycetes bacterium]|nr:prepilin-type N-terminal cleavage/methylation domain-containing protein [Planctomycetota bacterium]